MAIEKGGPLACLAHDPRRLTNDQDLVAVTFELTAALTFAFLWPASAGAWLEALAN